MISKNDPVSVFWGGFFLMASQRARARRRSLERRVARDVGERIPKIRSLGQLILRFGRLR
jgi:hypothetical protein